MFRFIIKRLLLMIPVFLGVLLIVFIINRSSGDHVAALLGDSYTPELYQEMREQLVLNDPYPIQFARYVKGVVTQFDLGTSFITKRPVKQEIIARLPLSIKIAAISLIWSVFIGVILGIISAIKQYSVLDYSLTTLAMVFSSMPSFWIGMMMMILFSLILKLLPATGLDTWKGYILPCITLGLHPVASFCRMTRSTMLEVIHQDYIRTARSKGIGQLRVIVSHALRNAAIPIVTLLGTQMNTTIGSAAVVESVFNIPGVGSYMISSIGTKDYPGVQGSVLVFSMIVCLTTIIIDILYGFLDPRIKAKYIESGKKRNYRET